MDFKVNVDFWLRNVCIENNYMKKLAIGEENVVGTRANICAIRKEMFVEQENV